MQSPPQSSVEPEQLNPNILIEEETFSWYIREKFYPVRLGQVLQSRYEVLLKLGLDGMAMPRSAVRTDARYVSLKIYMTGHRQASNEINILEHIGGIKSEHPGSSLVRGMLDSFLIDGEIGPHVCIVHDPLSLSLHQIQDLAGGKLPPDIAKPLIYGMLLALDFLHAEAGVVHTDIHPGNFMLSITDPSILDTVVEEEIQQPSPRKVDGNPIIYPSIEIDMPDDPGSLILCDFGDAKIGSGPFSGEIMPDLYRSPELILGIPWNEKIDIWAFGLMLWDLLEGKHLFTQRLPSREASSGAHLGKMIALLGAPPADLLSHSSVADRFFEEDGSLRSNVETFDATLESEEEVFEGDEKIAFLAFMQKMLQWRPSDRCRAQELLQDPWLQSFREGGGS